MKKQSQQIKLLLLDEEKLNREALLQVLRRRSGIVAIESGGIDKGTLNKILRRKPDIVLLLMDETSGENITLTLIKTVRQKLEHTKFFILAAKLEEINVCGFLQAGVHGILSRNISADQLVRSIRLVAAGEHVFSRKLLTSFLMQTASEKHALPV